MNTRDSFRTASKSFLSLNSHLFDDQPRRLAESEPIGKTFEREKDLHNAILAECRQRGWLALHGSMAHRSMRNLGEQDFTILLPHGKTLLLEAKSTKGKLRPEQLGIKMMAEKLGHAYVVVRTLEEFLNAADATTKI